MPKLTESQVLELAKEQLQVQGLTYDEQEGLKAEFTPANPTILTAPVDMDHWCVTYISQPSMFDQHDYFLYLSDETGILLHILGPHGKLRLK